MKSFLKGNKAVCVVSILILVVLGVVIGCSNQITRDSSYSDVNIPNIGYDGKRYELTAHEYIVGEYARRYSTDHYAKVMKENSHLFFNEKRNGNDEYLFTKFVVDNIDIFTDSDLYDEIIAEARVIFSIDDDSYIPNAFTEDEIREYMDYDHVFGGINILQFSSEILGNEWRNYVEETFYNELSSTEKNHYDIMFNMFFFSNSTRQEIIEYIENTKDNNDYSDSYKSFLELSLNILYFYEDEFPHMPTQISAEDINAAKGSSILCGCYNIGSGTYDVTCNKNHGAIGAKASAAGIWWVNIMQYFASK
jgi:hypothetical protein